MHTRYEDLADARKANSVVGGAWCVSFVTWGEKPTSPLLLLRY